MPNLNPDVLTTNYVELGELLANTLGAVVVAQEKLDNYTLARKQAYEQTPDGALAIPPLWYLFNNVAVELELSAQVAHTTSETTGNLQPHLVCRTLNPTSVSLYGYQASAGLRVRIQMTPGGPLAIKHDNETVEETIPSEEMTHG
jgi:hypothetical protein